MNTTGKDPLQVKSALELERERLLAAALAARDRRKPKMAAVVVFGRFQPPTVGHARLVEFVQAEAAKRNAIPMIFPSPKVDRNTNPLPFPERVKFLRKLFPRVWVNNDARVKTPLDVLTALSMQGADAVWVVVGSDQAADFNKFERYVRPRGIKGGQFIILKEFGVLTVPQERNADTDDVSGMSATKLRTAALNGDWESFRVGIPTRDQKLAQDIYQSVRRHMALTEAFPKKGHSKGKAFLLYGMTTEDANALSGTFVGKTDVPRVNRTELLSTRTQKLMESGKPFYVNCSGLSVMGVKMVHRILERARYATYIYVKETPMPRQLSESWVRQQAVYGMLRQSLARDLVVLSGESSLVEMVAHVKRVLAEAESQKPKEPSEVDRMKDKHKQEVLLQKKRQGDELLKAKSRELEKKNREDQAKLQRGDKPKSITR